MENNIYKEDIRLLRKAKSENRLVIFVGAGISKYSGLPLWGESINKISDLLNISNDSIDYLKIPQYYYNSRGKKEYTELMREIFGYQKKYIPNEIHKQIINLNVHTIITTNYDNLLEKAAKNNMSFVQVIRQDKDLAYCTSGRKIIKMHGAFETDNFVLKEDDYLNYSDNFKLIETHIKSLIARNVVLFLGYSYNDPDIKKIFNWVKEILKDDFQRAYLFNGFDKYNVYDEKYYKNLGINVIYAAKQYGKEFLEENSKTYIINFLKEINNKNNDEIDVVHLSIDDIYNDLKLLSQLNYIPIKNLDSIFRKYGFGIDYDTQLYNYDKYNIELKKIIEKLYCNKDKTQNYDNDIIKLCLKKSSINEIIIYDCQDSKIQKNKYNVDFEKNEYRNLFINFDLDKIKEIKCILSYKVLNNRAIDYLEYAYICYKSYDYYNAYRNLKKSSRAFYDDKNYVWYMISEYNRYYVGKFITDNFQYRLEESIKKCIKEEIFCINFDTIFDEIKVENYKQKKFLQDIYTSTRYYLAYKNVLNLNKEIKKNEKNNQITIFGKLPIESLKNRVMDIFNFDLYNYIMMDNYIEKIDIYRVYIERIISSYFSQNICNIEPFDFFIIIKYAAYEDLDSLLKENCKIKISLTDENISYIDNIIDNIYNLDVIYNKNYFRKLIVLAKYLKSDDKIVVKLMKKFECLLDYDNFNAFYIADEKKFMDSLNVEYMQESEKFKNILLETIDKIIDKIILNKQYYQLKKILLNYLGIYKKINDKPIEKLGKLFSKKDFELCIDFYQLLTSDKKEKVKEIAQNKIEKETIESIEYVKLLLNDVIEPVEKYEKKLIEEFEKTKNSPIRFGNNRNVSDLLSLYLNDKILNKEDVKTLIIDVNNGEYGWLIDAKNYNYENFDVNCLKKCNKKLLESISLDETMHSKIRKKIKECFLEGLCDSEIIKIYFEYFE